MIQIYISDISRDGHLSFVSVPQHKTWLFPAGEIGVKLEIPACLVGYQGSIVLVARLNSNNDFFELANVKNALEEYFLSQGISNPIDLVLPYIPYAQQDRVCAKGEAFSAKVFAHLLNSLNFHRVVVADPHSGISSALIQDAVVVSRFEIIDKHQVLRTNLNTGLLVAPDAGANKQTAELAKYFGHSNFIRADKLRDLSTGNIIETIVYGDVEGKTVTITDDLAVGAATFVELAKALKQKGAEKIVLYVTHGIFSRGTQHLFEGGIDEIYTTNSYSVTYPNDLRERDGFVKVDIIPFLLQKLS